MDFKKTLPATILIVFLIIFITSSFSSQREKERIEAIQKIEQAKRDVETKNYLLGKFDPRERADFALVPKEYSNPDMSNMYLRIETLNAFIQMASAAASEGIELRIASATRNFNYQKNLWNNQWSGSKLVNGKNLAEDFPNGFARFKKILEYVAVPGTSRHHWGTDIDINGANIPYFTSNKGISEYQWLVQNAATFGFCQTYRAREFDVRTGFSEEKWHWSYIPLARAFTEDYKRLIKDEDVGGFLGDEFVKDQDMVNQYALSINPECL